MPLLSDVVIDYLDYLAFIRYEQGVSLTTVYCYTSWSRHFLRWLEDHGNSTPTLDAFNTATLRRYLYYLSSERKHRPRTGIPPQKCAVS